MKTADQYLKIVEWSDEDGCYVGRCPGLFHGGVHGPDEAKVYRELCDVVDEWVALCHEDGVPLPPPTAGREYSGKFMLRITPELHEALAVRALAAGDSLNQYTARLLAGAAGLPAAPGVVGAAGRAAARPPAAPRRAAAKGRRPAMPA